MCINIKKKLVAFFNKLLNDFSVRTITQTCTDYQNTSFLIVPTEFFVDRAH